jgi:hypothetical protein
MLRRQNAMPYGGHAPAQQQPQQAPVLAAPNPAGPVEHVAPGPTLQVLSGGYQFLGSSSIFQEQPDTSRPPPSMLVEVNSVSAPPPLAQNIAVINRGKVTTQQQQQKQDKAKHHPKLLCSFISRQLAKSTDALFPPFPLYPKPSEQKISREIFAPNFPNL